MRIDRKQTSWLGWTTALGLAVLTSYLLFRKASTRPLTGGTTVGLWYGVAATILMLYVGFVFVALRFRNRRHPTSVGMQLVIILVGVWFLPLRALPAWRGQTRSWWLRFHVWFGLLSVLLVWCHSGFRWGGTLANLLWIVLGAIIASGVFGLALQHVLPRHLAERIETETPFEQIPHMCEVLARRADELVYWMARIAPLTGRIEPSERVVEFHETIVRPYLVRGDAGSQLSGSLDADAEFARQRLILGIPPIADRDRLGEELTNELAAAKVSPALLDQVRMVLAPSDVGELAKAATSLFSTTPPLGVDMTARLAVFGQDAWMNELVNLCAARRSMVEQERLYRWLHGWLAFVHIPLSAALLVLTMVHIVMALYY